MKKILCVLFCIIGFIKISNAQFTSDNCNNESIVKKYVLQQLQLPENCDIQLVFNNQSPVAYHYTYQITNYNIPVWAWIVKINIAKDGKILSLFKNIGNVNDLKILQPISYIKNTISKINTNIFLENSSIYYSFNNTLEPCIYQHKYSNSFDSTFIFDLKNNLLFIANNAKYLKLDTVINGKIFYPDPLTKMHQYYGGTYINNNYLNALWFDTSQQVVTTNAKFDDVTQQFILENKYAKIVDFNLPSLPIVTQSTPNFFYNRSQNGFTDVNAFFHVTNFHNYLDTIGYGSLMNLQINIDPQGQNGADNSVFVSGNVPTLDFGTGGVPDAEDADVIVHEYCHGVSWSANANKHQSLERQALDEGLADYFATSYSKNIDTFRWADMFTWDGHNEFWAGRTATTLNNYVSPFVQSIYYGGEIWNCAMMKIWDAIGRKNADKLMLQAMYSFTDSTTLPIAAALVIQADSLLYNSANKQIICNSFRAKNIDPAWGKCWALNNQEVFKKNNSFSVYPNPANNILNIDFENNTILNNEIEIFNIIGQKITSLNTNKNQTHYSINISNLNKGIYLIKANIEIKKIVIN